MALKSLHGFYSVTKNDELFQGVASSSQRMGVGIIYALEGACSGVMGFEAPTEYRFFGKERLHMKHLAILSVLFAMTSTIVLADGEDCNGTEQGKAKTSSSDNDDPSKILIPQE
jgi:hypothetical protein